MHRTIEAWKQVKPSAVAEGSQVQCANVLGMAIDDLREMGSALQAILWEAENGNADNCHEIARRTLMVADLMQPIRQK